MRATYLYRAAAALAVVIVAAPLVLYVSQSRLPSGERSLIAPTAPQEAAEMAKPAPEPTAAPQTLSVPAISPPPAPRLRQRGTADADQNQRETATPELKKEKDAVARQDEAKPSANGPIAPAPAPMQDAPKSREELRARIAQEAASAASQPLAGRRALEAPGGSLAMRSIAPSGPAPLGALASHDRRLEPTPDTNRDQFAAVAPNPVKQVASEPVSTFSIDVDTASYAFVRRALNAGRLPPKDALRVEEMINYFPYDYPRPESAATPFQPTVTVVPAPWNPANKLVHIAIKGYAIVAAERPRANLVFLVDVSGSMRPDDRLPLAKNAFRLLVAELKPDDTVAIVTYASGSGIALEPTTAADRPKILAAIDALNAGGSTAGAQGINDAYRLAEAHFDKTAVNRVILATDGDFNVGITNQDELKGFIERKRQAGIFLSIIGVGAGNYNDALMQILAQNGNGTAAYADTLNEARKILVDEASSTLFPIAKDVKIQVEFNPAQVSEYRLIGYETRSLRREDFNNDKVDAGDIGSGHTVTAIYEVTPATAAGLADELRYQRPESPAAPTPDRELGFLKLRYKLPEKDSSNLISFPITPALEKTDISAAAEDVRFSVAVAAFGQLLRGLPYLGSYGYEDVLALAQTARGPDLYAYRAEFLNLVRLAKSARP